MYFPETAVKGGERARGRDGNFTSSRNGLRLNRQVSGPFSLRVYFWNVYSTRYGTQRKKEGRIRLSGTEEKERVDAKVQNVILPFTCPRTLRTQRGRSRRPKAKSCA